MSFINEINTYDRSYIEKQAMSVRDEDLIRVLSKEQLNADDYLTLLSPAASNHLEAMAKRANEVTLKHFGRTVLLYTPIYIANHCANKCVYCSFNIENNIHRMQLNAAEIEAEAINIKKEGFQHVLLLTGEDRKSTPVSYIVEAVKILRKYFQAVSIEIYPLSEEEYRQVIEAGVSGLTIYQETYDRDRYKSLHLKGPKRHYETRLNAPEDGAKAGMRFINIGALLGLTNGIYDAFMTGLHAHYLQRKYPEVEYGVSLPRMRPHIGEFQDFTPIDDPYFVQVLLAYRLFLPSMSINISTREDGTFREHLIPLGATNMSAGVSTSVGGHIEDQGSEAQFEIADERSLSEMCQAIKAVGYQPVLQNWSGDF
jgi:2-iminoacetate synthase